MKKYYLFSFTLCLILFLTSCLSTEQKIEKVSDLNYTIITQDKLPSELMLLLEEKKAEPFTLSFLDEASLYLCVGYGKQETSGYSISINECYLGKNAAFIDTNLIGPSYENAKNPVPSYPYIVLKTKPLDLQIIFD